MVQGNVLGRRNVSSESNSIEYIGNGSTTLELNVGTCRGVFIAGLENTAYPRYIDINRAVSGCYNYNDRPFSESGIGNCRIAYSDGILRIYGASGAGDICNSSGKHFIASIIR